MKELLQKYFDGDISEEDSELLKNYFINQEEELDAYFSKEEWDAEAYAQIKNRFLSDNKMDSWFYQQEQKQIKQKRTHYVMAACACILLLMVGSWFALNYRTASIDYHRTVISAFYYNNNAVSKQIVLPDGSTTVLMPNAKMALLKNYNILDRDIELYGSAIFWVQKDTKRRFTVYSGNVATTAVGTIFSVDNSDKQNISVHLIEGEILVREKNKGKRDYYLLPGNAISYSKKTHLFNFSEQNTSSPNQKTLLRETINASIIASPFTASNDAGQRLGVGIVKNNAETSFLDVKLPVVLNTLARLYNVKIAYPDTRASSIRFAGKVSKHDDIQKILSDIAVMNNFQLEVDTATQTFRLY